MTETTADALAQVTELDEERRRYEGWLSQLEDRRGSVPEHVLARVRADYEARLTQVVERIGGHAELLHGAVEDLSRRVAELRDEEQRCADERAEGELRAAVGEYEPERWREIESRTDATMADLVAERQQVDGELARLRQVLELASPAAATAIPEAPDAGSGRGADDWATLERHSSVVGDPTVEPRSEPTPADQVPPEGGLPRGGSDVGAREDGVPTADVATQSEPSSWTSGLGLGGLSGRGGQGIPPADGVVGGELSRAGRSATPLPSEGGSAQAKTLRCQECGTMNYPTEWYCERCGGELAAL